MKVKSLSCVQLFLTPRTVAHQALPSMEFSRQEYWSGLPFPSPGDLPDPGIKPGSPTLQADALPSEPPGSFIPYSHFFFSVFLGQFIKCTTFGNFCLTHFQPFFQEPAANI